MRYKAFLLCVTFMLSLPALSADSNECKNEMDVHNKTNTITSSLLYELTNPNIREITDHYGAESKKANALVKDGKFQEACNVYQAVIDKYGFKSVEERYYEKHPEKRPENQKKAEESSATATSSSSAEAAALDSSSDSAVSD